MSARPTRYSQAEVGRALERIETLLGMPSDDGKGGTGLIGEVARIRSTVEGHDKLASTIRGGFLTLTVAVVALWWIIKAKVAAVLGVSP
jgi:hypothetical protein